MSAARAAAPALSCEVVVVGGGGAGLAAAAAAAAAGARTLLIEKSGRLGGTTRLAIGSITAAGTRLQRRAGIHDDIEQFRQDMELIAHDLLERDNPRLRRVMAQESGKTVDWLESLGVSFAGPFPEAPHRARRLHQIIPGPAALLARLERECRRHGVDIRLQAGATGLLRDSSGRVSGVEFLQGGRPCAAHATRGVVLAAGDFSGNDTMRQLHLPVAAARAIPINPLNVGDAHALAIRGGAAMRNMDYVFGPQLRFPRTDAPGIQDWFPSWPWLTRAAAAAVVRAPRWVLAGLVKSLLGANMSPSPVLFRAGAVLVDSAGRQLSTTDPMQAVAGTDERTAYIVMNAQIADRFRRPPDCVSTAPGIAFAYMGDYERGRPDLVHRADSIAGLAAALRMQPDLLAAALQQLTAGPYVALGPVHAMLTTTEGAADVDEACRVLDAAGRPIDGLHAAGCIGQGGLLLGRGHGLHLAWAFTSGRIAGAGAACASPSLQPLEGRAVLAGSQLQPTPASIVQ